MLGPYIFSRRSNRVVSSVRGGRKIGCVDLGSLTAGVRGIEKAASLTSPGSSDVDDSVSDADSSLREV